MTLVSEFRLMSLSVLYDLMYPVSVLMNVLSILDTFNTGVTIWYQSLSIQIVPWVINNANQVVGSSETRIFALLLYLVEFDHFDLYMTVRAKCLENEEDVAGQGLIRTPKGISILMVIRGLRCCSRINR